MEESNLEVQEKIKNKKTRKGFVTSNDGEQSTSGSEICTWGTEEGREGGGEMGMGTEVRK